MRKNILPLLHDMPVGDPYLCDHFPLASPVSIQHSYYHYLLNKYLVNVLDKENISIIEFGGGYGNFCRLTYNFGYTGSYSIIDFPEMQHIQQHFLNYSLPQQLKNKTISFYPTIQEEIFTQKNVRNPILFIGTYSLSETQMDVRQEMEKYYNKYDYIFISFGKLFDSIDNVEYFNNLQHKLTSTFDIKIIPDSCSQDCFFFLGSRKNAQ